MVFTDILVKCVFVAGGGGVLGSSHLRIDRTKAPIRYWVPECAPYHKVNGKTVPLHNT